VPAPTGGSADGARANDRNAGNAKASSPDATLALRSTTLVVRTAWPERDIAVFGTGSRSVEEQETIAAALEAASVAVACAALGYVLSEVTAAAVGATSADPATAAVAGGAGLPQPPVQGAARFGSGVEAPAFPRSTPVAAPTSAATAHPQTQIAPQVPSLTQRETAMPSNSGPDVSLMDEDCQVGPNTPALSPVGAFRDASAVYERPLFLGSEVL